MPTKEPEAELLIDSQDGPNTSRHLIGCQGGYHGEEMMSGKTAGYYKKKC